MKKVWLDIINPSHVLFFNSIIPYLSDYELIITLRDRAETLKLANMLGIEGQVIGADRRSLSMKSVSMISRTLFLFKKVPSFDVALSFENGMSTLTARLRGKKSILFCDNDLKFIQRKSLLQDVETWFKLLADCIIIPQACYDLFKLKANRNRIITFDGFKEDIYIANYTPDPSFKDKIPFDDFVVVRPEALGSFYVNENKSIVPQILSLFDDENINVIYLPREKEDLGYAKGLDVYVPEEPLNGLDLCNYGNVILTGSGTMAREAALMGRPSVSFFPSDKLLSVDLKLLNEGRIFYSRKPKKLVDYALKNFRSGINYDLNGKIKIMNDLMKKTKNLIEGSDESSISM